MPDDGDASERRAALRAFINERGLKVATWARDAGVPSANIYNFLNGKQRDLGGSIYYKLADAAGVSVDALFGVSDATRRRILDALSQLCERKRVDQVEVSEVCARAGVPCDRFAAFFASPQEAAIVLHSEFTQSILQRVAETQKNNDAPTVDRLMAFYEPLISSEQDRLNVLMAARDYRWDDDSAQSRGGAARREGHIEQVKKIISDGIERGDVSAAVDINLAARLISLSYWHWWHQIVQPIDDDPVERMRAIVVGILRGGQSTNDG